MAKGKKKPVLCVEVPTKGASRGATYGCSIDYSEVLRAVDRARERGFTAHVAIVERRAPPKGMRRGVFLDPFTKR